MIGSIEEPEINVVVPLSEFQYLKQKIKNIPQDKIPQKLKNKLKNKDSLKLLYDEIRWIRENLEFSRPFHEWLASCTIELPKPPITPRNPELEARVQRLKLEQQERDYQSMTRNVDTVRAKYPDESIASQGNLCTYLIYKNCLNHSIRTDHN